MDGVGFGYLGAIIVATPAPGPITELLAAVGRGDERAHERLWSLVYDELRRIARSQMANEGPGRTLQTTVLVDEAYLRLVGGDNVDWANRRHFYAAAAKTMRRIRIDDARRRNRLKRGGGRKAGPLDEVAAVFDQDPTDVLALDEAMNRLEQVVPRQAEVVMLRYFAGLTRDETARALDVSPRTVDDEWRLARAWLHRELTKGDTGVV